MNRPGEILLRVEDICVEFEIQGKGSMPWSRPLKLKALDRVSFDLYAGDTLGIVGESGCGKSTLARAIMRLLPAQSGKVLWKGEQDLLTANARQLDKIRSEMQMIYQHPLASLDPRMTIGEIIAEPLITHHAETSKAGVKLKVKEVMQRVGLLDNQLNRYPHEFSGGQCQRIGIARALIIEPRLIVCDEAVSALDVSIQAQVINLLQELQQQLGLSLIFIAHDLSVVRHISTRIMVLYLGHVVEVASAKELVENPRHPYTLALISAVPVADPRAQRNRQITLLEGDLPSPLDPPSGCVFRTRCPKAQDICAEQKPVLNETVKNHAVACHFSG